RCVTARPPARTSFPYTTLFRSCSPLAGERALRGLRVARNRARGIGRAESGKNRRSPRGGPQEPPRVAPFLERGPSADRSNLSSIDRKSTRLNSSHVKISYAVFC